MANATVCAAVTAAENTKCNMEGIQEQFICNCFRLAKNLDSNTPFTGMEPLVIKNRNARIKNGVCDLIEIHGFYTRDVVENAIFTLKDTGEMLPETITELVTSESGNIITIRFMCPKIRLSFATC